MSGIEICLIGFVFIVVALIGWRQLTLEISIADAFALIAETCGNASALSDVVAGLAKYNVDNALSVGKWSRLGRKVEKLEIRLKALERQFSTEESIDAEEGEDE